MSQPPPDEPPPSEPEPPPTLDPVIVADDEALATAVDAFILADPEAKARLREIANDQELLRQCVDRDVWRMVLALDEATVERWADLSTALARYAFEAGRRFPLPIEEGSP